MLYRCYSPTGRHTRKSLDFLIEQNLRQYSLLLANEKGVAGCSQIRLGANSPLPSRTLRFGRTKTSGI